MVKQAVEVQALDTQSLLNETKIIIDRMSKVAWQPSDGFLGLIYRAIGVRQHEALTAIVGLVTQEQGHAAVALLRPACEELIWLKYLTSIEPSKAEALMLLLANLEVRENLQVQRDFVGKDAMHELGFSDPFLAHAQNTRDELQRRLGELGNELGWKKRGTNAERPSVKFLAKSTDSLSLYNFLYHATSRSVHFTVSELLRRAWRSPTEMSIQSSHFVNYWSAFALYWGMRLYIDTLLELLGTFPEFDTEEDPLVGGLQSAVQKVHEFGQVPIITWDELYWPKEKSR